MRGLVFVVINCTACGRIRFDAIDDSAIVLGPWGMPAPAFAMSPALEYDDPSMSQDGTELFVNVADAFNGHVEVLLRSSPTDVWGPPVVITEIAGNASQPMLAMNDRVMYIYVNAVVVASMRDAAGTWSMPLIATDLNEAGNFDIAPRADGLEAIVTYNESPTGTELALVRRAATTDPWSSRVPIVELNLPGVLDGEGCLSENGLALYFGSGRDDPARDLYRATRPSLDQPFGPAERIVELNSVGEDSDPWVSADGRTIYFTTSRAGGRQVWTATR